MFEREPPAIPTCSFCEKTKEQVERLTAGPGHVYICNECVDICRELLFEDEATTKQRPPSLQLTRLSEVLQRFSPKQASEQ